MHMFSLKTPSHSSGICPGILTPWSRVFLGLELAQLDLLVSVLLLVLCRNCRKFSWMDPS